MRQEPAAQRRRDPRRGVVPLPGRPEGLPHLRDRRARRPSCRSPSPARPGARPTARPAARSNGRCGGRTTRKASSAPTATPCRPPRAARTRSGFRSALVRGLKRYAELTGNRKGSIITADDVIEGAAGLVSVFIEQPQFQGQTKEKLVSVEATKLVETIVGDNFEHWLTGDKEAGNVLLEHVVAKAEERLRRKQDREQQRKTATRKLRLPGKLADCSNTAVGRHRDLPGRGRFGRRLGQGRAQPRDPGDPAAARQDPERGQRHGREAAREPGDPGPHPGAGLRHRRALQRRSAALRAGHHHDRRRRRRRPHRLAADDVLLSRDAEADRERPPLPRPAAALSASARAAASSMPATSSTRTS